MLNLLLGSTSPRRAELLAPYTFNLQLMKPHFDEKSVAYDGDPKAYVLQLSRGKSLSIKTDEPLITADTIVVKDKEIFHKPQSREEARNNLVKLGGTKHTVYTGVTLRCGDTLFEEYEATEVEFFPLTHTQAHNYQKAAHSYDKAGGYSVQGAGLIIVKSIKGCYTNVVGLPMGTLRHLLLNLNIDLWNYLP